MPGSPTSEPEREPAGRGLLQQRGERLLLVGAADRLPRHPRPGCTGLVRSSGRSAARSTGRGAGSGRSASSAHRCSAGSCCRIACSRSRSSWPGSSPSSSARWVRASRSAASASPWRPGPGERERVQRPEPLAQRVPRRGLLGRRDHGGVVAQGEQAEHPVLLRGQPQLLQRGALGEDVGVVRQVGVRLPRPGGQRLLEGVDVLGDLVPARPRRLRRRRSAGRQAAPARGGGAGRCRRTSGRRPGRAGQREAVARGRW